ncbi:MAG TPA: aldehyde dehydrogenase family protein, partial [Anaerolineae bacterium]
MPVRKKTLKRKPVARRATARAKPAKAVKIPRITYASLKLDENDHRAYEAAVGQMRKDLGTHYSNYINGKARSAPTQDAHASPADTRLIVSHFPKGTRQDAKDAIAAARAAQEKWEAMGYKERNKYLRRAADLIVERRYLMSATMGFEVGKNRAESLAEVNESAELIRYYCEQIEEHKGFVKPLESPAPGQTTQSVLKPYGVWAVISPWNFPLALATGMTAGALVAGNAVVFKPASVSPITGHQLYKAYADAGIPNGVFNLVVGPGSQVGQELQENEGVDALVFTGSKEVGMRLYHNFAKNWPKPVITEMGGKNP